MMKLLIVLSIREMQNKVGQLLEEAGVQIFSVTDITGYKNRQHNIGWFGSHNGKENSILLFSFTDATTAQKALRLIESCEVCNQSRFPLRGFVLDVESLADINGGKSQ